VRVKDTGIGIDSEILPRVFSKYTTKSNVRGGGNGSGGTGIGLYICKGIIEAHGGKIWAENNNGYDKEEEKGATLSFSLPIS